jgi:hypothetical protein
MKILVVSRSKKLQEKLKLRRRKGMVEEVRFVSMADFSAELKAAVEPTLCYLDISGMEQTKLSRFLKNLKKNENLLYGIIDTGGKIKDAASLFHEGAVDYINRGTLDGGVSVSRLKKVLEYARSVHPTVLASALASTEAKRRAAYILSGNDWSSVIPGGEYTFAMMFIELDDREQMEKSFGAKNLSVALSSFRTYIDGFVKKFCGKLWMWFSFGGIVLFPFDAKSCPALTCAFRLMLFKHLYDVEGSYFPHFLSFRVVLQIGNVPFTDQDTGHIVSDSLNSIFHLGQQFVRPGNFCVTEEAMRFGNPALRSYFVTAGTFEGTQIMRMRRPVHRYKRNSY